MNRVSRTIPPTLSLIHIWTLNSEENWNRTHRLAGFLWVIAGLVMIVAALLHLWSAWIFVLLLVSALIPTVYSYLLYRKGI